MNSIGTRLKAIAVTALAFALGAFCLLGVVWALDAFVPNAVLGDALGHYSPHSSIAALTDLRAITALSATFLVVAALVLIIDSAYCDRMLSVFADVLLMLMAAITGFVAGYWVLLRLAGYQNFLEGTFVQAAIVCPLVVFLVSILPLAKLRAALPMRLGAILILLLGGPALVVMMG